MIESRIESMGKGCKLTRAMRRVIIWMLQNERGGIPKREGLLMFLLKGTY